MTFLLMNFFLAPVMIFMPWYAKNVYSDGISAFARLEVALAIGTVAGSALLSLVPLPGPTWKKITFSLSLMAISYLLFTCSHTLLVGSLALGLLGFFLALANVLILNFFQSSSDPQDVPVVMGMVNLISVASLPISMGVVGAVIDGIPVQSFASVCALIVMAIAMTIRFIPKIKAI